VSRSSPGLRHIHTTSTRTIAILEDRDGKAKASERSPVSVAVSDITEAEYHQVADEYLETLLSKFEELQDAREDVDVEFSVSPPALPSAVGIPYMVSTYTDSHIRLAL
jgi:frataxin